MSQLIGKARLQVGDAVDVTLAHVPGAERRAEDVAHTGSRGGYVTVVRGRGAFADLDHGMPVSVSGGKARARSGSRAAGGSLGRAGARPSKPSITVPSVVKVPFNSLVVATGSDYEPPMKANHTAYSIASRRKALHDAAAAIRAAPDDEGVLVVGGGAVGVELAAEIVHARGSGRGVTLVHSGEHLLEQLGQPTMGEAAEAWLREHGVDVVLSDRVVDGPAGFEGRPGSGVPLGNRTAAMRRARRSAGLDSINRDGAGDSDTDSDSESDSESSADLDYARYASGPAGTYRTSGGRQIVASLCYKCVGSLRNLEFLDGGAAQAAFGDAMIGGRLAVDGNMQVVVAPHDSEPEIGGSPRKTFLHLPAPVFAGGDCALQTGSPDVMLAHSAEMQGHVIAHEVLRSAREQSSPREHGVAVPGQEGGYPALLTGRPSLALPRIAIISLGPYEALLCMNGLVLSDPIGRRLAAFAKVMIEWSKMLQVAGDVTGWAIWVFGDWAALLLNASMLPPGHSYAAPQCDESASEHRDQRSEAR